MSDETKVGRIAFGPSDPNREGQCRAFGDHAAAPGVIHLGSGIATGSTSFILETAQLRAEVAALTAALADAKAENAELSDMLAAQLQVPRLAKLVIENDQLRAQLAQQRWRSVAEEMPTVDGNYLVRDFPPDVGAEVMILARDAINPGCWDFWFGPLPDLPSSEEQAK